MGNLHFRISQGGKAIPGWVRIVDSENQPKVPFGRNLAPAVEALRGVGGHWVSDDQLWTAESGSFEIELDAGVHWVEVRHFPAWSAPTTKEVSVLTRQLSLRMALDAPLANPPGWVAGDLRVHGISPNMARIEAEASGMGVVQVQAGYRWPVAESPPPYHELFEVSGAKPAVAGDASVAAVNTLNRHPMLGSASLLHAHRPTYPWGWGWEEGLGGGEKDWAVSDWLRQCHRIKGVTVWPELDADFPEYEMVAALVLGDVDVVELSASLGLNTEDPKSRLPLLYDLFDHGVLPRVAGASGKDSNRTRTGEKFAWVDCGWASETGAPFDQEKSPWTPDVAGLDRFMAALKAGDPVATVGPWFAFSGTQRVASFAPKKSHEVAYLGMVEGGRLQAVSCQGVLWEQAVASSTERQSFLANLSEEPQGWIALRLVDGTGRLLAHGSPRSCVNAVPVPGPGKKESRIQQRLHQGLAWLSTGRAGYFTPQIVSTLEQAVAKLDGTSV